MNILNIVRNSNDWLPVPFAACSCSSGATAGRPCRPYTVHPRLISPGPCPTLNRSREKAILIRRISLKKRECTRCARTFQRCPVLPSNIRTNPNQETKLHAAACFLETATRDLAGIGFFVVLRTQRQYWYLGSLFLFLCSPRAFLSSKNYFIGPKDKNIYVQRL